MTRLGGFRTRLRVQGARALWITVRNVMSPSSLRELWHSNWHYVQSQDRQRVCPHPWGHWHLVAHDWIDCGWCDQMIYCNGVFRSELAALQARNYPGAQAMVAQADEDGERSRRLRAL